MKNLLILLLISLISFQLKAKEKVNLAAQKSVELTYEEFGQYDVKLNNRSGQSVDISVVNPITNQQVKGFGLGAFGKVVISIDEGLILKVINRSERNINLHIDFVEKEESKISKGNEGYIKFTLHNSSGNSIPLIIPNVMNPNLSPFSNSGVSLRIGQKIYYKANGKKQLLLIVDNKIRQGDKLDVAQLIKNL